MMKNQKVLCQEKQSVRKLSIFPWRCSEGRVYESRIRAGMTGARQAEILSVRPPAGFPQSGRLFRAAAKIGGGEPHLRAWFQSMQTGFSWLKIFFSCRLLKELSHLRGVRGLLAVRRAICQALQKARTEQNPLALKSQALLPARERVRSR